MHIGCRDGDEAMYLVHGLSRYVPHFIALAASSPFSAGRRHAGSTVPGSTPCWTSRSPGARRALLTWADFVAYFERIEASEIATWMKDFYWDIRPKPEFGTVEVRVCDSPLTVRGAAVLAAYMQALAAYLLDTHGGSEVTTTTLPTATTVSPPAVSGWKPST